MSGLQGIGIIKRIVTATFLFIISVLTSAYAAQSNDLFPAKENEPTRTIYLVSHGWHAGIVLQRTDLSQNVWPTLKEFTRVKYLEIGWGDKDYYTTPDPGMGLAVKAAIFPTSSVLHIVGFSRSPERYFPNSEIIEIELSDAGFEKMIQHISKSFTRDDAGQVIPLGAGLYGNSHFYESQETYHLFKTCNIWTAGTLQTAGFPVTSSSSVEDLMSQARELGKVIQSAPANQ